jgi:rare lipoprotein A
MPACLPSKRNRLTRMPALAALALSLVLAACGSVPQQPASAPQPAARTGASVAATTSAAARRLPALPAAGSGRGGYYLDDGPGDAPPGDLMAIPDAEPKIEPYSKAALRPYVVFGKTYTPIADDRPLKQRGVGSWYGKKFHGQKTSSGELYDMYQMTAAHPTLPIPSYARVTNLKTGAQVIVRVNDRGPFRADRIIDLSYTAALKLGYLTHGSTELEVERLLPDEILRLAALRQEQAQNPSAQASAAAPASMEALLQAQAGTPELAPTPAAAAARSPQSPPAPALLAQTPPQPVTTSIAAASGGGFYLQLGAYSQAANAEALRMRLSQNWSASLPPLAVVQAGALFRVHSGPFASRADAAGAALQIPAAGAAQALIVQR